MSSNPVEPAPTDSDAPPDAVRCDYCGAEVDRVSRIALDGDYERLQTPHRVQYACESCSKRKEAERRARVTS